jgi:hypothetical protein
MAASTAARSATEKEDRGVGFTEGSRVGNGVNGDGLVDGKLDGSALGDAEGGGDGRYVCVGAGKGTLLGEALGALDGNALGAALGAAVGDFVGLGETEGCGACLLTQHGHHSRYVKVPSDVVTSAVSPPSVQPS